MLAVRLWGPGQTERQSHQKCFLAAWSLETGSRQRPLPRPHGLKPRHVTNGSSEHFSNLCFHPFGGGKWDPQTPRWPKDVDMASLTRVAMVGNHRRTHILLATGLRKEREMSVCVYGTRNPTQSACKESTFLLQVYFINSATFTALLGRLQRAHSP